MTVAEYVGYVALVLAGFIPGFWLGLMARDRRPPE